jgi:C1A family cysteine protease
MVVRITPSVSASGARPSLEGGPNHMSNIETNMHDAPQVTYEEAMVGRVIPVVRVGPAIVEERGPVGLGWLRDLPDFRDYTSESAPVASQLEAIGVAQPKALTLASRVDLRQYCSPIENQGALGSCTANATVGLVEYFERRAHGKFIDASRLFLYKVTRDLLHWTGDTGAYLRSTMGALALFGVPPEEYCPYDVTAFDNEPSAMCFAFASNFRAIAYYRLDPAGTTPSALLDRIKANLSAGLPSVFGFTVYSSISQAAATGRIPYPTTGDKVIGGHAMLMVGYDDNITITNANNASSTKGAFIVRNSWGPSWGDHGYGMLPYSYVTNRLAVDFWSLTNQAWTDTGAFRA